MVGRHGGGRGIGGLSEREGLEEGAVGAEEGQGGSGRVGEERGVVAGEGAEAGAAEAGEDVGGGGGGGGGAGEVGAEGEGAEVGSNGGVGGGGEGEEESGRGGSRMGGGIPRRWSGAEKGTEKDEEEEGEEDDEGGGGSRRGETARNGGFRDLGRRHFGKRMKGGRQGFRKGLAETVARGEVGGRRPTFFFIFSVL